MSRRPGTPPVPSRTVVVAVEAGCFTCSGTQPMWTAPNAIGVAARHHKFTGHRTWCDRIFHTVYDGDDADPDRQAAA